MEEQKTDKIFADGIIFKKKDDKAPDFVKGHLAIKASEAVAFIEKYKKEDGWLNLDLKKSQGGKLYLELNTWKPEKKEEDIKDEDIPF